MCGRQSSHYVDRMLRNYKCSLIWFVVSNFQKKTLLVKGGYVMKMYSVVPFTYNTVDLCVVTIDKSLKHVREMCKALEYGESADRVNFLWSKH